MRKFSSYLIAFLGFTIKVIRRLAMCIRDYNLKAAVAMDRKFDQMSEELQRRIAESHREEARVIAAIRECSARGRERRTLATHASQMKLSEAADELEDIANAADEVLGRLS